MKSLLAILFVLSGRLYSADFLKKSQLLNEVKAKAYVGDINHTENKITFSRRFKFLENQLLYQVTKEGKSPLLSRVKDDYVKVCGGSEKGVSFNINPKGSPMIFSFLPKNLYLHWITMQKIKPTDFSYCLKMSQKLSKNKTVYFRTNSQLKEIFYITWLDKGAEIRLGALKERLKIKFVEIGRLKINANNKCEKNIISSDHMNPFGKGSATQSIVGFYGILSIRYLEKSEKWIILDSPGYEGKGILAVPFDAFIKGSLKKHEWLVYTGC